MKKNNFEKSIYQMKKDSVVVSTRIPRDEYEQLCETCESAGISISQAVRKGIRNQAVYIIPGLKELTWQVSKVGTNINQIAKSLNSQQFSGVSEDVRKMQADIHSIKLIMLELGGKAV